MLGLHHDGQPHMWGDTMRGIIVIKETYWHWNLGHQCVHAVGDDPYFQCDMGYLTGEPAESMWEKESDD